MTTIAFDGKRIAVDSRITDDDRITSESAQKLWLINGIWYAFCGQQQCMILAVKWFKAGKPKAKPTLDSRFKCLSWDGKKPPVCYEDNLVAMPEESDILAYGSGAAFAMGAMAYGADAHRAVKIAAQFDIFTNSRVQVSK